VRVVAIACLLAALVGAGAATAVLLATRGDSESSSGGGEVAAVSDDTATVPSTAAPPPTATGTATSSDTAVEAVEEPVGSIAAGSYVQAASFRSRADAEAERRRLEAVGAMVSVADSDQAEELYPGFQVLIAGPFSGAAERRSLLRVLHRNGAPTAFARPLTPANQISGSEAMAGRWAGTLELSGFARPVQNGNLAATLETNSDASEAELRIPARHCAIGLSLAGVSEVTVSFAQDQSCLGGGEWVARPEGGSVALTLLPPGTGIIVVGRLEGI